MKKAYFVTGTDTGVGKTRVSVGILQAFGQAGRTTAALKPIATGCNRTPNGLRSDDAQQLVAAASVRLPYATVNPYALEAPIAPNIAARESGVTLDIECVLRNLREASDRADVVIVEGIGGWLVPLNDQLTMADLVQALQVPVILVVGLRLGCLNHALLTAEAIQSRGIPIAGWIANTIVPELAYAREIVETLAARIPAPWLGTVPWLDDVERMHTYVSVDPLL